MKVDQNIPREGFSLKSTWDVAAGVAWDTSAAYANIYHIDRWLSSDVQLSSTSQASRRLSAIVGDENIL